MKKIIQICLLLALESIFLNLSLRAQSVAINADSSKADASAILDLKSTKKGMLLPRMTMTQRNAIAAPAAGLLIYQTDNQNGYYYFDGSAWVPLKNTGGGTGGATNDNWSPNDGDDIHNTNPGNVGIGTVLPPAKLTIKTPLNSKGFMHIGVTDSIGTDSIVVTESIGGVSAGIGTQSNHPFRFITHNVGRISILADGNVTIGDNNAPEYGKLTVQTSDDANGIWQVGAGEKRIGTYLFGNTGGLNTTGVDMALNVNSLNGLVIKADTRNIGIAGEMNPKNKFQIGSMGVTGYNGNDFALGNGTQAFGIAQTNNISQVSSSTDFAFISKNGSGNIGINTRNPRNKLEIGYINPSGFLENYNNLDLAIGNGTNAASLWQNNENLQITSTTDMFLLPRSNGGGPGKIGINTATPKAPLDVENFVNMASPETSARYAYYGMGINPDGSPGTASSATYGNVNVSIFASNHVMALQFDAFSDARIKNIIGISNAAKDLQTLNALQITDYSFKDKIKNGNKVYKKVIAQQVERVYPQVVSTHVDFIPNVYQLTSKIEETAKGFLLSFAGNHHISKDAKKLQVIFEANGNKKEFDIIAVPSASQVIVAAPGLNEEKLFVYGEEVHDFRTVDYEALTTLNISATQQLSREITRLQKIVEEQGRQIQWLLRRKSVLKKDALASK